MLVHQALLFGQILQKLKASLIINVSLFCQLFSWCSTYNFMLLRRIFLFCFREFAWALLLFIIVYLLLLYFLVFCSRICLEFLLLSSNCCVFLLLILFVLFLFSDPTSVFLVFHSIYALIYVLWLFLFCPASWYIRLQGFGSASLSRGSGSGSGSSLSH